MARVLRAGRGKLLLVAETEEERALLDHARCDGGLILDEAWYPVREHFLILPEGGSMPSAIRLAATLRQAADRHRQAVQRRSKLQVV